MSNLTGTSFLDVNGDGVLGPNDQRLAGATIFTDLAPFNAVPDPGELSAVTDANGDYLIPGLEVLGAGTGFQLQQVLPPGVVTSGLGNLPVNLSVPADPATDLGPIPIVNPVVVPPVPPTPPAVSKGNIQGVTYVDNNLNRVFDLDEPVVGGIPLYLDLDENGVWTANEEIAVSDAGGFYAFNNLNPGTYQVRPLLPANDLPPGIAEFVTPFADDLEQTNTVPQNVTVFGGSVTFQDLGYVVPGSIYGVVVSDLNGNGVIDGGETGLPGIVVSAGGDTATTDANGFYLIDVAASFPDISEEELAQNPYLLDTLQNRPELLAESFPVQVVNPPGNFVQTGPLPDFDVVVPPDGAAQKNFFFNVPPNIIGGVSTPDSITGFVFTDVNINSAYEQGEPLLPGVTVYLDINKNGELDSGPLVDPVTGEPILDANGIPLPAEPATVTGPGGNYGFFDVSRWLAFIPTPIEYIVRAEAPEGLPFVTTGQPSIFGEGLAILADVGASGVEFGLSQFPVVPEPVV
ncbi:MAG: Cna B-type [Limnospira sp.]